MTNSPAKRGLVGHELFRKMGLEGAKHEISRQIPILSVPVFGSNQYVKSSAECTGTMEALTGLLDSYISAIKLLLRA